MGVCVSRVRWCDASTRPPVRPSLRRRPSERAIDPPSPEARAVPLPSLLGLAAAAAAVVKAWSGRRFFGGRRLTFQKF